MNKTILTITGPTCSGKSTLTQMLVDTGKFTEIVSTTTRPRRSHEVNGQHYHFVTLEEFDNIDMLEVITYNGNRYGGSVAEFEDKFASDLIPAIVVDPGGMLQINLNASERGWRVINIFVDCPPELQARRILNRFVDDYRRVLGQGNLDEYADLMGEYEGRLGVMMGTETDWRNQFDSGSMQDDSVRIERFGKENEKEVLDKILSMV